MGSKVSVCNDTPYNWYYATQNRGYQHLGPGCYTSYEEQRLIHRWIYFKYENRDSTKITFEFNTHKGDTTFRLRETGDRSQISLNCTSENSTRYFPNYGKIEEDHQKHQQQEQREQERRRQEELRRQERLERERRIEEELDRESQLSTLRLSQATERLVEKQRQEVHEHHEERTQVLQQQIEDDAAAIERDEVAETEKLFEQLLLKFQISEDEGLRGSRIEDRIKALQNELVVHYCTENQLSIWSQFTFDHAVNYSELSLTERLDILQASLDVSLNGVRDLGEDQPEGWEKKYDFLFGLVEGLYVTNPSLAEDILLNVLDSLSDLSHESKEILGHMMFNQIWTPSEIMLFLRLCPGFKPEKIDYVLQTAQTFHLECLLTVSALRNEDSEMFLQHSIKQNGEKDVETIMKELCEAKCPENISDLVQDVLVFMESELPKYVDVDLTQMQIDDLKKKIRALDLRSPDVNILKEVLIGMSVAVQDCTTLPSKENPIIPGYFPRLTQLASLLLLLLSEQAGNKGCLLEIGTGEGKSSILAMFATIMAIRGVKVDIVTSSPVLARRDQEEWKKFLDMFGVSSSVVPPPHSNEELDKLVRTAYQQQIVYSTAGTFAADTLKEEFEKKNTRNGRAFELVIVDEVDYMTLDKGVQVTFLSHESSGLRHIEQILASIWAMVSSCQQIEMSETGEIKWVTRMQYFHKAITGAVIGQETSHFSANEILSAGVEIEIFSQEDVETVCRAQNSTKPNDSSYEDDTSRAISEIMKKVTVPQQYDLLKIFEKVLEDAVMIECFSLENQKAKPWRGESDSHAGQKIEMLLLEGGLACEIMSEESLIKATSEAIKSSIKYSDKIQTTEDSGMVVPVFLKSYVEDQLPLFVKNALQAVTMCQGREYMIDVSAAAEKKMTASQEQHEYHGIIPVDFRASGILEKNKKWGNGLQQFLEFKHRLAVSPLSNVTNYMSNFHYFKKYIGSSGIFGVSGTLGGDADRDFLARHYETNSYLIPVHRHKRVVELPAIQVNGGNEKWLQTICETTTKAAKRGQVVLIICEDVKTANELHEKLKQEGWIGPDRITLYTISEKHNIEREKFGAGRVIIATNLGGRGTDIKVEDGVNRSGGLFVLLTHFPHNRRVEKQILGRTGRKGNPGMFQMVLNSDHLAPAYQNQSVEIMRRLREQYEVKRIQDMESDELVEINLKEKLFETFCRFLKDFDKHYTVEERRDPLQTGLDKLPTCFTSSCERFDYHPAINALKESWALWLTLHETEINNHEDFKKLESDLLISLNETTEKLLKGKPENFYDLIRQAVIRTDLHFRDKTRKDFGAKSYWKRVESSDPWYKAVALYNQAYITINLAQGDYRADARRLLLDAKKAIQAHVCEVSNTMMNVDLSVAEKSTKNDSDANNFQSQMEARMNIFQSWMKSIEAAIAKLDELIKSKSDAITEESSVYSLSEEKNFIVLNEMIALYNIGLGFVFEVKKKPKFCFDALICFFLGALQVLAGILVCALSFGSATQFGLSLISEGVSDMISGIEGMIKGTFDWASWAISKAISIGISLLTAGFSTIKNAISSVYKVTKGLLNGTKSFSSVASDVIKSGKAALTSLKGSVSSGVSSLSKEGFKTSMKNGMSSTVLKQNLRHATEYAAQELVKKSVISGMNLALDKAIQEFFKAILKSTFQELVSSAVKQNSTLDQTVARFIGSGVPKAALQKEHFKIDQKYEKELKKTLGTICESVVPDLIWNLTTAHEVIGKISEVCSKATEIMDKMKLPGISKAAQVVLKLTEFSMHFTEILKNVPTKQMIDDKFVPELLKSMEYLQKDMPEYDQNDKRHELQDVQRLKAQLLDVLAEKVSDQFLSACSEHITSSITKAAKGELNRVTEEAVDRVTRRNRTQRFFDDQRHKHNMTSASHKNAEHLPDQDIEELKKFTEDISNVNHPASGLDIHILTKSKLLNGKGIQLTVVDEHGNRLSKEHYQGTDRSAGDLKLRLTKYSKDLHPSENKGYFQKVKLMVFGKPDLYAGHFDIMQDDGKIIRVSSDHQNCFYQAVAQATNPENPKQEALKLRQKVKDEVQSNLERYAPIINLQRGYEVSHTSPGRYTITGGTKKEIEDALPKYYSSLSGIKSTDYPVIREYHLGFVGKYKNVKNARKINNNANSTLNADHVPPLDSVNQALTLLENSDPGVAKELKNKNSALYTMITSKKEDRAGSNLVTMEVLREDHKRTLTIGSGKHVEKSRKILRDTLISGDGELLLKRCMILHHPISSQQLIAALGGAVKPHHNRLSEDGVRDYYNVGYSNLVEEYSNRGVIDQNQSDRVKKWLKQKQHEDPNGEEYQEILQQLQEQ